MKTGARFAYAQARLQARLAALPAEEEWQRLAAARTLAGFLEEARNGALRDWVKPFSGQSDTHDLEVGLRALYREQVGQVAAWLPTPWRPAMTWTRWLVLLPLFDHLARGGDTPAWVARDHDLLPLLDEAGDLDRARLSAAGAGALIEAGTEPAAAWAAEWRRRWPPCNRELVRNLEAVSALIAAHLGAFRDSRPGDTWDLRRGLRDRLRPLFHRRLLQPAAPFIYLALAALDMERLRAELVSRALFPSRDVA